MQQLHGMDSHHGTMDRMLNQHPKWLSKAQHSTVLQLARLPTDLQYERLDLLLYVCHVSRVQCLEAVAHSMLSQACRATATDCA